MHSTFCQFLCLFVGFDDPIFGLKIHFRYQLSIIIGIIRKYKHRIFRVKKNRILVSNQMLAKLQNYYLEYKTPFVLHLINISVRKFKKCSFIMRKCFYFYQIYYSIKFWVILKIQKK